MVWIRNVTHRFLFGPLSPQLVTQFWWVMGLFRIMTWIAEMVAKCPNTENYLLSEWNKYSNVQVKERRCLQWEMWVSAVLPGHMWPRLPQELGPQVERQCRHGSVQISGNVEGTGKDMMLCLRVCLKRLPDCHGKEEKDIFWKPQVAHGAVFSKANFATLI